MTVIGILSGKGGVGKTTIAANLGVSLTRDFNQNVLIVDANVNSSHLGLHLGMYEDTPVTLADILKKNVPVNYAIYLHPTIGVRVLPAPLHDESINLRKLGNLIQKLKEVYDIVILDTAPGLGKDVVSILPSIDTGFIVTTPDLPSLAGSIKTINLLKKFGKTTCGVIVNRVTNKKYELLTSEIESTCNHSIAAVIPEDKKIPEAISRGVPVVLSAGNSDAAIEIKKLSARIIGRSYEPRSFVYKIKQLINSISNPGHANNELPSVIPKSCNLGSKEVLPKKTGKKFSKKELKGEIPDIISLENRVREELKGELKEEILKKVKERLVDRQ